jgi:multidrug efflux system membrane fusion protein
MSDPVTSQEPEDCDGEHPVRSVRERSRGIRRIAGILVSITAYVAAFLTATEVARNIRLNPRTEDAQVRANMIGVSSQVGGAITAIHVKDNQRVRKGDLLLELDSRPYEAEAEKAKAQLALTDLEIQAYKDQITAAEAELKQSQVKADYAVDYAKRVQALVGNLYVTVDKNQLAQTEAVAATQKVEQDKAALARARNLLGERGEVNVRKLAAQASLRDAELKLSYCKVYAPCDGFVVNLQITPGAYAATGEQIFSIVDDRIWYVMANFRETDLRRVRPGMAADVYLLANSGTKLRGIVQGVPKAITPQFGPSQTAPGGQGILQNVSPTLDFILLAQRFPVRIVLDEKEGHDFRNGGTAAVVVRTGSDVEQGLKRLSELQTDSAPAFRAPLGSAGDLPLVPSGGAGPAATPAP